ncbi:GntR family transcriptional regulator [Umezawaea beigongshangensis]|uniref:GntR family transcriptional regulator n=1 Tax=Umezawaea beigongshangensis TaxID=2780383 RepID=UPI0018F225F1|nr:winged helix-turn-helix domain-containing protein [Umezawaea beigongshangensis]
MQLPRTAGHPYQALAADVVAQMERGSLNVDDQLPSVRELAKTYGVTIATAQRAVSQLASDGYVRTVPGLGTFVTAKPVDAAGSPVAVTPERFAELEAEVAELAKVVDEIRRKVGGGDR